MIDKKNKTEFIKYLINEYSTSNVFLKDFKYKDIDNNYFLNLLSSNDLKTFLIIYSDEVLNTFNMADKNYLWENLSSEFASKMIKKEAEQAAKDENISTDVRDILERAIENEGFMKSKEGSMKSFGLWDRLSKSEEFNEEFKDGIYGINYKIIYEKLEKILERDVYPAMSQENPDV